MCKENYPLPPSRQTVQSDYLIKHIDGSLEAFIDADLSKTKQ